MPTGRRKSSLLGPSGQPVSYFLYPSPRHNLRQYKPRYWLGADTKTNVGPYDRWELVNYSRQLFAQIGNLSTAVKEKNSWSFGDAWDAHYCGTNAKWGQEAEEFLKFQFYPMGNVRGPQYDLKRSLRLSGQHWDIDGDDAMVLTEGENHFPKLAFFPGTRIGSTATGGRGAPPPAGGSRPTMENGAFSGAEVFDGIIYDRNSCIIGIQIVNPDGTFKAISSFNADLAYEPDWCDQGRGIPRVATCLLRWMNLQDIDEFIQRGMKRAAAVGLKFKKEGGEAGLGNEIITSEESPTAVAGETRQIHYEEIEGGEMYYLDSAGGEEIEALKYENPHNNSEAFVQRIVRECLASVGWRFELMDLSSTGRAPSRLACDVANQSIWDRQFTGDRRWRRAIGYAIAKGMKHGFISRNDDGMDPYLWEPGLPARLSVDAGNEEQADRENLKMGTTSKAIVAQKKGLHHKDIRKARFEEVSGLIADAQAIKAGNPEVSFDVVMALLEQRSPNGVMMQAPTAKPQIPNPKPQ
jgi:hypothetical protein